MKKIIAILMLSTSFCFADVEDTRENRVAAVQAYLKVLNVDQITEDMMNAFANSVPEEN